MEVPAGADRFRQYDAGSVYGLEYVKDVTPASDFLDKNRGKAL